jgi:hypothetical protein
MATQSEIESMARRVALEMSSMKHFTNRTGVVNGCIIALQNHYGFMPDVKFTPEQEEEIIDKAIHILKTAQACPEIAWC